MLINNINQLKPTTEIRKKMAKGVVKTKFNDFIDEAPDTDNIEETSPIHNLTSADNILALQQYDEEKERKKTNIQKSLLALDSLEKLHNSLIHKNPEQAILVLEQLTFDNREKSTDEALEKVVDDIEIRAAIELEKIKRPKE